MVLIFKKMRKKNLYIRIVNVILIIPVKQYNSNNNELISDHDCLL